MPSHCRPGAQAPAVESSRNSVVTGARAEKVADEVIDGKDIGPLLAATPGAKNPHEAYYFYRVPFGQWTGAQLEAVRSGRWKLILPHTYRTLGSNPAGRDGMPAKYQPRAIIKPELYDLDTTWERKLM